MSCRYFFIISAQSFFFLFSCSSFCSPYVLISSPFVPWIDKKRNTELFFLYFMNFNGINKYTLAYGIPVNLFNFIHIGQFFSFLFWRKWSSTKCSIHTHFTPKLLPIQWVLLYFFRAYCTLVYFVLSPLMRVEKCCSWICLQCDQHLS